MSKDIHHNLVVLNQEKLPTHGTFIILPNHLDVELLRHLKLICTGRNISYISFQNAKLHPSILAEIHQDQFPHVTINLEDPQSPPFSTETVYIFLATFQHTISTASISVCADELRALFKLDINILPAFFLIGKTLQLPVDTWNKPYTALSLGQLLPTANLTIADYQVYLYQHLELLFNQLPALQTNLAYALLAGLKKFGNRYQIIDGTAEEDPYSYKKVLAIAIALSKEIKKNTTKEYVGIVLTPGRFGLIANIAVLLANKIPVNLNYTASTEAALHSIKESNIDIIITADILVRKFQAFPWLPNKQLILLERLIPTLISTIKKWYLFSNILPLSFLASILGITKKIVNPTATLLFTSGSSGKPKGVRLTHQNIISNVIQFSSRLEFNDAQNNILGSLPLFHSFGCTVTLWYPIICGLNLITNPSPLETKKIADLISKWKISLMISTPTFLRAFLRGINSESLISIKMIVTGAEKLPQSLALEFKDKFNKEIFEGYGLTETSPVTNVNLVTPKSNPSLEAYRFGSVGQLMPGINIKITATDSEERLPLSQKGIIWFRGANVFQGYLNDPDRTALVFDQEGWFKTGDLGHLDQDGFLHIDGRLSRFSKIGGEMVPHETLEEAIVKITPNEELPTDGSRAYVVVGIPDVDKGEALVLLSASLSDLTPEQELKSIRTQLLEQGLPSLWIPKRMLKCDFIPTLTSGKLDIQACQQLALTLAAT